MNEHSDAEFVAAALAADKAAFGVLIERYTPLIQRVIWHRVYDHELMRDLAQETFLQAFLSLDSLRDPANFRSWLIGIALNVCRMFLRRRTHNTLSWESLQGGLLIDTDSPEAIAERLDLRRTIATAVSRLSPASREAVSLFYYEAFSLAEAAAIMGITVSALKVRLHRARQHLKIMLASTENIVTDSGEKTMQPVKLVDVAMKEVNPGTPRTHTLYRVILLNDEAHRALVIYIGEFEALMIAMKLNNHDTPRPMTQVFIARLLNAAGATVEKVAISELKQDTFYATVYLKTDSGIQEIDARPSDAMALALYANCPIFVSDEIMANAGMDVPPGKSPVGGGLKALNARTTQIAEQRHHLAPGEKPIELTPEQIAAERQADMDDFLTLVFG